MDNLFLKADAETTKEKKNPGSIKFYIIKPKYCKYIDLLLHQNTLTRIQNHKIPDCNNRR